MKSAEFEFTSHRQEQTIEFGAVIGRQLHPGDVVTLQGELGAGKTCLVRGLAEGLGIDPHQVSSPTFVICQEYHGRRSGRDIVLAHIDAYRLRGPEDLESIGWQELLESGDVVLAIEWPERIAAELPPGRIAIELTHESDHDRRIHLAGPAERIEAIRPEVKQSDPKQRACRTCGKPVSKSEPTFPFCSNRCRLADLGQWFNEGFRMTRQIEADDELEA